MTLAKGWGYRNRASTKDIIKQGLHKKLDNEQMKVYTYDNYNFYGDWIDIKVIYNKLQKTKKLIFINKYLKSYSEDITELKSLDLIAEHIANIALNKYTSNREYKNNISI
jgi:hypothetical protein